MTQTFEQWAESEGLDMSVDWKGELTSPVTAGALRGWEAAQSAGQEPVYQTQRIMGGWDDVTQAEFARTHESRRRIVYTKAVGAPELVAHVRKLVNGEILDSTGCLTRWEDLPDGTPIYANAAPVNGGERTDHDRLVRELDVLLNGEHAASQASLCDIVSQVRAEGIRSLKGGERYAELEREHFGDPDKRTGIYAQRSADAQQVGDLKLSLNEFAALQRQIGAEGYTEKLTNQSNALYRQLRAALTSPAKVGGDEREAAVYAAIVQRCEVQGYPLEPEVVAELADVAARAALSADGGEDKRDAERYRFLEEQVRAGTYRGIISRSAIDAAIAANQARKGDA
jgi:hypothetical protein